MSQADISVALSLLRRVVEDESPMQISVTPDGAEGEIGLHRQIDVIPEAGIVKLSYRLGGESGPSPSQGATSATSPTNLSPMAIDTPPTAVISIADIAPSIPAKLTEIERLAKFIYRKNKGAVVSRTPTRPGPITLDMRHAPHEEAD
jgi:hypothetical protein